MRSIWTQPQLEASSPGRGTYVAPSAAQVRTRGLQKLVLLQSDGQLLSGQCHDNDDNVMMPRTFHRTLNAAWNTWQEAVRLAVYVSTLESTGSLGAVWTETFRVAGLETPSRREAVQ